MDQACKAKYHSSCTKTSCHRPRYRTRSHKPTESLRMMMMTSSSTSPGSSARVRSGVSIRFSTYEYYWAYASRSVKVDKPCVRYEDRGAQPGWYIVLLSCSPDILLLSCVHTLHHVEVESSCIEPIRGLNRRHAPSLYTHQNTESGQCSQHKTRIIRPSSMSESTTI